MLGNPELPTAVGRGQEVCVVARMVVTQRGEVREVELLEVDGALDAGAIVETLQRWTFEPPLYEGVSADVTLVRPFTVRLLFPAEAR
jgi:outer membrane biosynthesis protein TonB